MEYAGGGAACTQPTCGLGVVAQAVHQMKRVFEAMFDFFLRRSPPCLLECESFSSREGGVAFLFPGSESSSRSDSNFEAISASFLCRDCTKTFRKVYFLNPGPVFPEWQRNVMLRRSAFLFISKNNKK